MSVISASNDHTRVGIFWDYENCAPPSGVPGYVVAEQIRKVAHNFGSVTVFRAYLELSTANITPKVINLRSELQSSGVSVGITTYLSERRLADCGAIADRLSSDLQPERCC
ncbi:hypothetical protein FRC03_003763 [Tulasnella sp. 419]|nr:hypothetical protein FRC03_003763 [Tulasnella sp. 419]